MTQQPTKAEASAAPVSPDPERIAAILARAHAGSALIRPPPADSRSDLIKIHADAGRFYQSCLPGSWVPGYVASRRLDPVLLPTSPWKIGYAPRSWTALTGHLRDLGYSDEAMLSSGLITTGTDGRLRDRFHDRLMVPLRRPSDRVAIAFIGRRHPAAGDDRGPKYLNSPNTGLYVKGHVLAGLAEGHRYLDAGAQPVLVEGLTDAFAVSIAAPGRYVGLPLCGTALSGEQVAALARAVDLPERGVRLALDPDPAGSKAAIRAYASLATVTSDLTAVILGDKHDPAEMLQYDGPAALRSTLTSSVRPLVELVIDGRMSEWESDGELASTEQQFGALRAAGEIIATLPPDQATEQASRLWDLFSHRYGWEPAQVTRELVDALERHLFPEQKGAGHPCEEAIGLPPRTSAVMCWAPAPRRQAGRAAPVLPAPAPDPSAGLPAEVAAGLKRGSAPPSSGRPGDQPTDPAERQHPSSDTSSQQRGRPDSR
jgi:DNA primase